MFATEILIRSATAQLIPIEFTQYFLVENFARTFADTNERGMKLYTCCFFLRQELHCVKNEDCELD